MTRLSNSGNDLRSFMGELDELGELRAVNGAGWNLEIGALTEIGAEQNGPALLFDEIKGYPKGFRLLCSRARQALSSATPVSSRGSPSVMAMSSPASTAPARERTDTQEMEYLNAYEATRLSVVMAGHSASRTRVNALMSRPSTTCLPYCDRKEDVDARPKSLHSGRPEAGPGCRA